MKTQKGITLIALIITIIVMLILVGVSVSVALNTGLFKTAQGVGKNTQLASEGELLLSVGIPNINGVTTEATLQDYVNSLNVGNGGGARAGEITFSKISAGDLAIGSEVRASNGETFYVIGFSADNTKVNLLAKYNLNSTGSSQDTSGAINFCAFCSEDVWNAASVASGDNLNNKESIKAENTSAVAKAIAYGESLGGTGRLMLKAEADKLKSANSTILYGQYEDGAFLRYCLGSAYESVYVYYVSGGNAMGYGGIDYGRFDSSYNCGVRPVIEILKSDI